ncbi:MAG TPA: SMP-30/gluconolactonase/LRE family protein [Methylomirabilota bacterium]|nr:SMP-30/gluconolactonase/LRE family protein [Methylomirabilota bacterium]
MARALEGRVVRLDPRFDRLVPPGAGLEKIAAGFTWVEGPVWDRSHASLLFSDIPRNSVFDATSWTGTKKGTPDGVKVDLEGNLFAAGPGGVHVFAPDGAHLGSIELDAPVSNVGWGSDGSVLYVTASTAIYRIALTTRGVGF